MIILAEGMMAAQALVNHCNNLPFSLQVLAGRNFARMFFIADIITLAR